MKRSDRKTKIEAVLRAMDSVPKGDEGLCWIRLGMELSIMTEPDARPPRFNALLRAIWTAATHEQS